MINIVILIIISLIFLLVAVIVGRAVITDQKIIGRPPVPVFYFILAKLMVVVNLAFLLMKGLNIKIYRLFDPGFTLEVVALVLLMMGVFVLFLSTFQLNKDLIFGLSDSEGHQLQTKGKVMRYLTFKILKS